jgi:transposase
MAENQIQTPDDENEPEEDPLLVREAQLIEMLARGMKVAEASRRTGMSLSTIHRRLRCRKFKAQVDEFREDLMSGAASRTAGLMDQALDTLAELMDAQQTPGVRMQSAKGVLETAVKFRETLILEKRIDALEEIAKQSSRGE